MADALVSPAVGGGMAAVSAGLVFFSARKMGREFDPSKIPLMGVMGAFIFAGQMINFAIPGTGSSGHIGGGMLLAAVLGACPAFLTIACVLAVQAFFFADGGLLALGCNIFNMGFFPCFIAYPLLFRPLAGDFSGKGRIFAASIFSCIVALQLGAFAVVLETLASGVTELPFKTFALLMQPIHLAIGAVEGVLTGMVLVFLREARPGLFTSRQSASGISLGALCACIFAAALAIAGGLSAAASSDPDGLEWAMEKTSGGAEIGNSGALHSASAAAQEKTSVMPDYAVSGVDGPGSGMLAGIAGVFITAAALLALRAVIRPGRRNAGDAEV